MRKRDERAECIFCKIIEGKIPCTKVFEDDLLLAFMDIQPINPGHILIAPKEHVELIADLSDAVTERIFITAKKINRTIRKSGLKVEGINYFLADGEAAGQEVFHTHLHIFPRYKGDGFVLKFPEGYGNKPIRSE